MIVKQLMRKSLLVIILIIMCSNTVALGDNSLDDVLSSTENQVQTYEDESNKDVMEEEPVSKPDNYNKNEGFINGLKKASDVSAEVEGVANVTSGTKKAVAFAVQVLSYVITLTATGALTSLGFMIAQGLVDGIAKIGGMI